MTFNCKFQPRENIEAKINTSVGQRTNNRRAPHLLVNDAACTIVEIETKNNIDEHPDDMKSNVKSIGENESPEETIANNNTHVMPALVDD